MMIHTLLGQPIMPPIENEGVPFGWMPDNAPATIANPADGRVRGTHIRHHGCPPLTVWVEWHFSTQLPPVFS